jgi:hypothetical protein
MQGVGNAETAIGAKASLGRRRVINPALRYAVGKTQDLTARQKKAK